ncbi:MAG: hypothetical protein E7617_00135 [Ruminococcaceae bacterium]|nr:hypothetical protein [Oscillospiraceae bacterium]
MKKRIISMILVLATVALTLVGCGYNYAKEDQSQYAAGEKAALDAFLAAIEIEDGDYTADPETRTAKVLDRIYETLLGKVDTKDTKTEGALTAHDALYYCYYVTLTKDSKDYTVYSSYMKESSKVNFQLGIGDNSELQKKIAEAVLAAGEIEAYKTKTSGKALKDAIAYVTYTVSYQETDENNKVSNVKETHTNERVVLGEEGNLVANKLVDSTIGTAVAEFKSEDEKYTYTGAVVNWVVESGKEIVVTNTTFTESQKVTPTVVVDGAADAGKVELKDQELTYHIYPVHYLDVEELTAELVFTDILATVTKDSLDCLEEGFDDLIKTLTDKKKALSDKEKEVSTKKTAVENAEKAVETAKGKVPSGEKVEENQGVKDAEATLNTAKSELATAEANKTTAKNEVKAAAQAIIKKVGSDDAEKGATTVLDEYKKTVSETLEAEYNEAINKNLATAIWEAIDKTITIKVKDDELPKKAIKDAYNRIYEEYEHEFYTESDTTTKESYYLQHKGSFKSFLMKKTATDSFEAAKNAVWAEAVAYIKPIIKVYYVAELYGQTCTKKEIREYKKDITSGYDSDEFSYGEANALAAFQFDKLMDYFLEVEKDSEGEAVKNDNGTLKYIRVKFTTKEAKDK